MNAQMSLPGLAAPNAHIGIDPWVLQALTEAAEKVAKGASWAWCLECVQIFRSAQIVLADSDIAKLTADYRAKNLTRIEFVDAIDARDTAFDALMTMIDQLDSLIGVHVDVETNARRQALAHQPIAAAKLALHKAVTQRLAP